QVRRQQGRPAPRALREHAYRNAALLFRELVLAVLSLIPGHARPLLPRPAEQGEGWGEGPASPRAIASFGRQDGATIVPARIWSFVMLPACILACGTRSRRRAPWPPSRLACCRRGPRGSWTTGRGEAP